MKNKRMLLGCFCPPPGHHMGAWRFPNVDASASFSLESYIELVKKIENAFFDFFFISDGVGIRTHYESLESLSKWGRIVQFEPTTLMAALSTYTKNLGFVSTASTSYNEPFNIARRYASLDLISGGRMGWNIVTSVTDAEAQNFNRDKQMEHSERYERANEFVEVVTGLWNSWDEDAFILNKSKGIFFDPKKAHILNYEGRFFKVKGPLNVPRSPQGRPVLVQAGSSSTGKSFAAKWAEIVFTAQDNFEDAFQFRKDLRELVVSFGRKADSVRIMPGLLCVIGRTDEEAYESLEKMQSYIDENAAKEMLISQLGDVELDFSDMNALVPALPETKGSKSRQVLLLKYANENKLTLRDLMNRVSVSRGHLVFIGSGQTIANEMLRWFKEEAVDGFNVMPTHTPEGLDLFISEVLPCLREAGVVQNSYASTLFRENLERNYL